MTDYLKDIKNSGNNEKQFYEIVVQIGRKEDTGVLDEDGNLSLDAQAAKEILDEYVKSFQERNPNLRLFNAVLHMDEATPHLHLDYIPVAHGYKTKMHTRNSLTKALQEMGIEPATGKLDNETMHWQKRERDYLMGMCRERDLEVEILGEKRDNYTIPEYKAARQAADELTAEIEILNAEKEEAEAVIALINSEAEGYREDLQDRKKQLEEIATEIQEREKRYDIYQKKIDKIIAAEKPVKKELDFIRKKTKEMPSILGGEKTVKMPEKDFERLMTMAQAAGTLEKLNEVYDRDLNLMQGKIEKLSNQVQLLKDKLSKAEAFIKVKGLLEEFKESLKSQTIVGRLKSKQKLVLGIMTVAGMTIVAGIAVIAGIIVRLTGIAIGKKYFSPRARRDFMRGHKEKHMSMQKVFAIILIIVLILLIGIVINMVKNAAYSAGYDRGFSDGYSKGEGESAGGNSYSIGYDAGYHDALTAYGLNPSNLVNSEDESWPYRMLVGEWIEVGELATETPRELYVTELEMSLFDGEENQVFAYTLPQIAYTQDRPDGEVYLELKNCKEFVHFILHEEELEDGSRIPILSATIAELDERGEIIIAEFAKMDDVYKFPSSFCSSSCILRDEQDAVSMRK